MKNITTFDQLVKEYKQARKNKAAISCKRDKDQKMKDHSVKSYVGAYGYFQTLEWSLMNRFDGALDLHNIVDPDMANILCVANANPFLKESSLDVLKHKINYTELNCSVVSYKVNGRGFRKLGDDSIIKEEDDDKYFDFILSLFDLDKVRYHFSSFYVYDNLDVLVREETYNMAVNSPVKLTDEEVILILKDSCEDSIGTEVLFDEESSDEDSYVYLVSKNA